MKRVLFALCLLLPLMSQAQKRHEFTFCFNNPDSIKHFGIEYLDPDFNGAEINLANKTLLTYDEMIAVTFVGRANDGRCGVFKTGWPEEDGTFDHYLFIARGGGMRITAKQDAEIDAVTFSTDTYTGNLALVAPLDKGTVSPVNFSWSSRGSSGNIERTDLVEYTNNGQLPEIRAFTVVYYSPMDVLAPVSVTPADKSELHSIETIEIAYDQPIKLGESAKFELTGPRGFNPVKMVATLVDNTVVLSLPEGVTIDESTEARRGTYTLTIAEMSIISDDADEYYNKKTVYTFNVVEAYNKFEKVSVYPDDQVEQVTEIPNGIVIGFAGGIGKFSSDEIKLVDRDGNPTRTMQAQWLDESEYVEGAPFYKHDKDIYTFVKFVFTGPKTAAVKATGLYHFTVPEGFVWNDKWDSTADDEGVSAGALFNPEYTIEYNVNGVVYPSDEVLQAAKDLLEVTGAGYPAADSPARVALQNLVTEGIGTDAVFEDAMQAFYAETDIEMPSDGYYLLTAVPSEGDEVYVSYEAGKVGLTKNVEDAAHLLATVNEDNSLVFTTPDGKYLTQMMPTGANVTDMKSKMNNLTFARLVLKDDEGNDLYTPQQLFGLWSINGIVATNDEGEDIRAYTLVNLQSLTFGTDRDKSMRYFSTTQTNAFRLTETDAPVPDATYTLSPAAGSEMESLYYITLTFSNDVNGIKLVNNEGIVLKGTSTRQYTPSKITNTGRQFVFYFDDVAAGTYTLTIPKGAFTYTYNEKTVAVKAITASYRVNSSAAFVEDFLYMHSTYYYNYPNIDTFVRDVDLNNFSMVIYDQGVYGLDTNKAVTITDVAGSQEYARGHLVFDDNFVDEHGTKMTHMVLVMDESIQYGTLPTQTYCYNIYAGTFGDSNFAEWLKDPQNKRKGDCHVNAYLTPMISVDNDKANMIFNPQPITSHITKLSDITITFPYFNKVDIADETANQIEVLERYTGYTIITSIARVEGANNQFTFASDEILTADTNNGGYMILIPQNFFKAGEYTFPAERDMELFYYAMGNGDAIDGIGAEPQAEVVFDLSGRRVANTSKPGIYIINGKKVVVK